MAAITVKLEGVDTLMAELKTLDDKYKRQSLKKVLRAASNPVLKRMRALAPMGKRDQIGKQPHTAGNLRRSIWKRFNRDRNNPVIYVGPNRRKGVDAFYSHMVIGGTKAHDIPKKGNITFTTKTGKSVTVKSVRHPGTAGSDFVTKAFETTRTATMQIMKEKSIKEFKRIWDKRKTK